MWVLGEHRNMKRGDRESKVYMTIDVMHEQLLRYHSQELGVEIPVAAFMCGQSVLQWWAPWMKDAPETPPHYNRKNRPAWFSAEIASYCRYGDIKYAGQTMRAHQYHVCNWNGQYETVPEPFLMKREGVDSGLVDPDFWEDFITRKAGRSSTE